MMGAGAFDGGRQQWGKLLSGGARLARELLQWFAAVVQRLGAADLVTVEAGGDG